MLFEGLRRDTGGHNIKATFTTHGLRYRFPACAKPRNESASAPTASEIRQLDWMIPITLSDINLLLTEWKQPTDIDRISDRLVNLACY